jgi:hypothetical protein
VCVPNQVVTGFFRETKVVGIFRSHYAASP